MTNDERRAESRVRSRGRVTLLSGDKAASGTVYDVSLTGLGVDADIAIHPGAAVKIDGEGFTAAGIVRYCGPHHGRYRIGIELCGPESAEAHVASPG
jgi:hypothetical protein